MNNWKKHPKNNWGPVIQLLPPILDNNYFLEHCVTRPVPRQAYWGYSCLIKWMQFTMLRFQPNNFFLRCVKARVVSDYVIVHLAAVWTIIYLPDCIMNHCCELFCSPKASDRFACAGFELIYFALHYWPVFSSNSKKITQQPMYHFFLFLFFW